MSAKAIVKVFAGGAIFSAGALLGLQSTQQAKSSKHEELSSDESWKESEKIFKSIAGEYDSKISMDEFFMGMLLLRRFLVGQAEGKTLEVSAGTGRNLPYYDAGKVTSLICSDTNREMLLEATEKVKASRLSDVRFCIANAEKLTSETAIDGVSTETKYRPLLRNATVFPPNYFDTVVDTFGLCSCSDPRQAVKEMVAALKPGKGLLILLEHGQGTWGFVNRILDAQEKNHFNSWGCNFNRDIVKLIEDRDDLEILHLKRWHFGTTVACVARRKATD